MRNRHRHGVQVLGLTVVLALLGPAACIIDELREDDVGDAEACEAAMRWPRPYAEREDILFELINDTRARGGECGGAGRNPVADVELSPELRCAARVHATDLSEHGTLSHDGSDGSTTLTRVDRAEYLGLPRSEVLAADFDDPQAVLDAWLSNPAHCDALFEAQIDEIGIGYAETFRGDTSAWVLLTGQQR
jgi:uncharacterized protein YkwD